jgi:hypothetical protein
VTGVKININNNNVGRFLPKAQITIKVLPLDEQAPLK